MAWYTKKEIREAINGCLKVIGDSGMSAAEAEQFPEYLKKAIMCGNDMALQNSPFKAYELSCEADGRGGFDVNPVDLMLPRLRQP